MPDATSTGAGTPAFRKPEVKDLVFSAKAFAAAAIALGVGFGQGFENPYWSVLTVYVVVNPPGAGAVRSKSLFRFIGTIIGGAVILLAAAAFADHMEFLLAALIAVIVVSTFLQRSDRTPTSYIWFAIAVTAVAVGVSRISQPSDLFDLVTARVGEIVFGILVITAIDGVFWPRVMTPEFLQTVSAWRGKARDWMVEALADRSDGTNDGAASARHESVRELVKQVTAIDAQGVQLPFDPIALAPRSRHIGLLRAKIVHLVAGFGAIEQWAAALRHGGLLRPGLEAPLDAVVDWLRSAPVGPAAGPDDRAAGHVAEQVAKGDALARDLDAVRAQIDPATSHIALLQHGLLTRLSAFVRDWADLALVLRAIETGGRLPRPLAEQSARVKPVRSTDHLAAALDVAPIVVSMGFTAWVWYLTAWNEGLAATIFSFVACFMLIGKKPAAKTVAGIALVILVVFAIVLCYEFAVLPRVTDFPVLLTALGCFLLPAGVLMAIHPIGVLLLMLVLSMLGLQNAYRYDFEQTIQTLSGGVSGLVIGIVWLRLLDYDRARFATRRLADAARLDVIDVARSTRPPDRERYLSLAVDRVSLFFKSTDELKQQRQDAPPADLMNDLSLGNNLLALRWLEGDVSPHAQAVIRTVRSEVAHDYRRGREERRNDTVLKTVVAAALDDAAVRGDQARAQLLDALTGIQLALGSMKPATSTRP